jgi:hypothetical protein
MSARQLCNFVYSSATAERDEKELAEFEDWLYAPLDTREIEAEKATLRSIRGY